MSRIFYRFSLVAISLLSSVGGNMPYSPLTASAASPLIRVAFQVTGPSCMAQQGQLLSSLSKVEGIRSVDLSSVPGHALVDIDVRILSIHDLTPIIRQLLNSSECLADPMESCISATPLSRTADASQSSN